MNECHVDGAAIIARYDTVVEKVADAARKAGRNPEDVKLIAVSKRHPAESIKILNKHGQLDFGENYVQEVLAKQEELAELTINWHFIGHLQSKKAKDVAGKIDIVFGTMWYRLLIGHAPMDESFADELTEVVIKLVQVSPA
jgi:PLP dependent protein